MGVSLHAHWGDTAREHVKLQQGTPMSVGTNREVGPGFVCAGALLMLSCRSHYRAGFCREVPFFMPQRAG